MINTRIYATPKKDVVSPAGTSRASGGDVDLTGYATQAWVNESYLSLEFFNSLFKAYAPSSVEGEPDVEIVPNSGDTSLITNVKSMFGFWTEQYISALGQGESGSGGSSALIDLVDVNVSSPEDGQALVYDGTTSKWINKTIEGGGGSGTGTVTSITAGTGLSGGTITATGTIAIDSTYQTYISNGNTAYGWGNHANAGYLTSSSLNGYATQTWVNNKGYLTSSDISDMATKTWVNNKGYLTSSDLSGYATQTWVNNKGYLTSSDLSGYATQTWVNNKGYLTSSSSISFSQLPTLYWADVAVSSSSNNNTTPHFGSVRIQPGTARYGGYLYFGDESYAYICEPSDDSLQYKVGNSKTHIFTVGSTNRMEVNSSGLTVNGGLGISGFIDGATNIELKGSGNGGYIDFHYNGSSADYTSRIIESSSGTVTLQGNFVASGGVTALSDARLKDITGNTSISVEQIANMPSVYYQWKKGDKSLHVGSIAQDWQNILPEVVVTNVDNEGNMSLNYGVAALISAITTARKVVELDKRIREIESIINKV